MTMDRRPTAAPAIAIEDVAAAVGGRVVGTGGVSVRGASVDSRRVTAGSLFVALPGERVDGHAFVGDAVAAGAAAALVERPVELLRRIGRYRWWSCPMRSARWATSPPGGGRATPFG